MALKSCEETAQANGYCSPDFHSNDVVLVKIRRNCGIGTGNASVASDEHRRAVERRAVSETLFLPAMPLLKMRSKQTGQNT